MSTLFYWTGATLYVLAGTTVLLMLVHYLVFETWWRKARVQKEFLAFMLERRKQRRNGGGE